MSSCLSGGTGRAYGFDIENIVKCPSTTSSRTSHSSSPSSTLSESSNSPIAISNRKPRTPRKRPNQTYNEAAVLLSIACPKVFSTKNLTKKTNNLSKFTGQHGNSLNEPPELLLPFPVIENSGFLLHQPIMEKPSSLFESKVASSCESPREIEYRNCNSGSDSMELCDGYQDDFDTESMLDEEIEGGIDSIMGSCNSTIQNDESTNKSCLNSKTCYGYPMGLGFGGNLEFNFSFGMRNGVRALKNGDDGNWWSFPTVNVVNISPPVVATAVAPAKIKKAPVEQKKKKVEELLKMSESESGRGNLNQGEENSSPEIGSRLLLKLNYDDVLSVWSDKGSPLPEEISGSESPGGDIHAKLARIDLFSENGALREASVMRYKEKKRTRLFSKKIRYQVRKVNADRRPRSKGRFVRRPNSPTCEDT
ncbi:protein CHLOROPLAST IMPORT APPARATUS 2-like [Cynara cardunculus var. scolymus]|uniref:CCT domain-containing protein n=1 Tax=Cynara cardunculus var. scolymus TaxID=59895 RepID=A0A124SEX5_CYNCS|nr:protein CHLOROPLAST IMPORT APPARATUS 2-like [Cynara cardunculus var. scolymus]KVI01426.1 CCT domain-containing protein [Cynara cardunculus var. scolymus]